MPGLPVALSSSLADFCGVIQEAQRNALSFDVDDLYDARRWFLDALPEEETIELERRSGFIAERVQACPDYRDNKTLVVRHCLDVLLPGLRGQVSELRGQELSLLKGPHSDSTEVRNRLTEIRSRLVEIRRTKRTVGSLVSLVCEAETEKELEVRGEDAIRPFAPFLTDHLKKERRLLADLVRRTGSPPDSPTVPNEWEIAAEAWGKAAEEIEKEAKAIDADGYRLLWYEEEFRAATDAPPKDDEGGTAVWLEMRNEDLEYVKKLAEELVESGKQTGNPPKGAPPKSEGHAKPRGRGKDPCTKRRADFAKPMREDGHNWPEIVTAYQDEHPDDTEVSSDKIRQACNREYPAT